LLPASKRRTYPNKSFETRVYLYKIPRFRLTIFQVVDVTEYTISCDFCREEPAVKGSRASLTSTIKLDSDDEGSLAEYGDIDAGKFNEDGSFIGQYATADKKKRNFDSTV